jgi:hypothetical protein
VAFEQEVSTSAKELLFVGSVKWLENSSRGAPRIPGTVPAGARRAPRMPERFGRGPARGSSDDGVEQQNGAQ